MKNNKMTYNTYNELVALVGRHPCMTTRFDVVGFLVIHNGVVTKQDMRNISRLYVEGYIAE